MENIDLENSSKTRCLGGVELFISEQENLVSNSFLINKEQKIQSLSDSFFDTYCASSTKEINQDGFYAKVFKNTFFLDLKHIKELVKNPIEGLVNPLEVGITSIDNQERIVIIFPKVLGVSLGELLDNNEKFSDKYLIKDILFNANKVLIKLHQLGIKHGSINLDNVFLTNTGKILISECFSSPCGYYQPPLYETIDNLFLSSVTKNTSTLKDDYYSLGVMCFELFAGKRHYATVDDIREGKLNYGSYKYLTKGYILTGTIHKVIIGLLNDNADKRLLYDKIFDIPEVNKINFYSNGEVFKTPIEFNGKKIRKDFLLGYEFLLNKFEALKLITSGKLTTFLDREYVNKSANSQISKILADRLFLKNFTKMRDSENFVLASIISILIKKDIIIRSHSETNLFYYNDLVSLSNLVFTIVMNKDIDFAKSLLFSLRTMINQKYPKFFMDLSGHLKVQNILCAKFLSPIGRLISLLYTFIPDAHYLGSCAGRICIFSPSDLLIFIEKEKIAYDTVFNDEFLIPYLFSYLDDESMQAYNVKLLDFDFGKLLFLFSKIQKHYNISALGHVNKLFIEKFSSFVENYMHSRILKDEVLKKLQEINDDDDLEKILTIVTSKDYFIEDQRGFERNSSKAKQIMNQIQKLQSYTESFFHERALEVGLKLSYILLGMAVLFNIFGVV